MSSTRRPRRARRKPGSKVIKDARRRGVLSGQTSIVDRQAMTWKPTMLDPRMVADRAEIGRLTRLPTVRLCDGLRDQLAELVRAEQSHRQMSSIEEAVAISDRLEGTPAFEYGAWFHYPWSGALVHVLPVTEFRSLRTGRSSVDVPPVEQERLSKARIAVAGLSVGLAAATTLAFEGIGGRFALADCDLLAPSDLSRLAVPVCDLGLNRAILAARRLLELDPYLQVEVFPEGVSEKNIDAFLGDRSPGPSLLVEACDDMDTRIRLRERARQLCLPVLMETGDGGLHIQRFDLEPELVQGLVPGINGHAFRGAGSQREVSSVLGNLGLSDPSSSTAFSLVEFARTSSTRPQLASRVALSSALVSDAAKRVLLGTVTGSGRCRLALGRLVDDASLMCDVTIPELGIETQKLVHKDRAKCSGRAWECLCVRTPHQD